MVNRLSQVGIKDIIELLGIIEENEFKDLFLLECESGEAEFMISYNVGATFGTVPEELKFWGKFMTQSYKGELFHKILERNRIKVAFSPDTTFENRGEFILFYKKIILSKEMGE